MPLTTRPKCRLQRNGHVNFFGMCGPARRSFGLPRRRLVLYLFARAAGVDERIEMSFEKRPPWWEVLMFDCGRANSVGPTWVLFCLALWAYAG